MRRSTPAPLPCSLALAVIIVSGAQASPFLEPGESFRSVTAWEASGWLGFPTEGMTPGFGGRASLGFEGLPLQNAWWEIGIGYRWLDPAGSGFLSAPGADLRLGLRIPFAFMSVSPYAGVEALLPLGEDVSGPAFAAQAGARADFRLYGRRYLSLGSGLSWPFDPALPPSASLSASFRNEEEWFLGGRAREAASLSVSLDIFSPDGDGVDDRVSITAKIPPGQDTGAWTLRIVSPRGKTHRAFKGKGTLPSSFVWDGSSDSGRAVEPGEIYTVRLERGSGLFRETIARAKVMIDILLVKEGDRYKIRVPDIRFPPDSYALGDATSSYLVSENRMALSRIALLFKRFPGYSLSVEGHANSIHWADPEAYEVEEREELQPLSRRRADAVRAALMSLGVDGARIKVRAFGGTRPIYAFGDSANAWKNRRVEFLLSRQ